MTKPNLIILYTGNSARSQMAEAFHKTYASDHFEIHSSGFEPKEIDPYAIQVMEELGYDLSDQYSKNISQFLGQKHFGIVNTMCQKAEEKCPTIPVFGTRLYWLFEDTTVFEGTVEEKLAKFREIRDSLFEKLKSWLKERGISIG
jgi:arsenate reductase